MRLLDLTDEQRRERRRQQCREAARRYRRNHPSQETYEEQRERQARYRERHREKINAERLKRYSENREQENVWSREWRRKHPDRQAAANRRWFAANPGKQAQYNREYPQKHPARVRAIKAYRRAAERNATPPWVDRAELREFYEGCPDGYHVDHIIPLVHPDVSGLHVPWNLQYLPAAENQRKSNRFDPERGLAVSF